MDTPARTNGGFMAHATGPELRAADELASSLLTVPDPTAPALATLPARLAAVLDAEQAGAYGLVPLGDRRTRVDFVYGHGFATSTYEQGFDPITRSGASWGLFHPTCPQPEQRNRAHLFPRTVLDRVLQQNEAIGELFHRCDLANRDQLRVLVCDGPALLAWVGAFRREPFTERERDLLDRVGGALQRRLVLERALKDAPLARAGLAAALEALGAAAFVVDAAGRVRHANAAGRALLDADPRATRSGLERSVRDAGGGYGVTPLSVPGLPPHFLALRRAAADPEPRARAATSRWGLTPREAKVLARLATGKANKTIAAELDCAESTVEIRVTSLLRKAECDCRAALVARFWTE
jgi:DNA-binding CsgD family transcriptional regulator/PAS domain-containing protein